MQEAQKLKIAKFLEFFSIVGFGLAYWRYDLNVATMVLMILMTFFVVATKTMSLPLNRLQLGTWVVVMLLGAATLLAKDDIFIKWKTTVINSVLALGFALSHFIGKKTLTERLIGDKINAPTLMLRKLNASAVCYFILVGALNIVVAFNFSTTVWVNFKLFGLLALNMVYIAGCLYYLRDYLKDFLEKTAKK